MVEHLVTLVAEGVRVTFPEGRQDYFRDAAAHAGPVGAGRPRVYHFALEGRCLTHPYTCAANYGLRYAIWGNCLRDAIRRARGDRYPPLAMYDTAMLGPLQADWWKDEP